MILHNIKVIKESKCRILTNWLIKIDRNRSLTLKNKKMSKMIMKVKLLISKKINSKMNRVKKYLEIIKNRIIVWMEDSQIKAKSNNHS